MRRRTDGRRRQAEQDEADTAGGGRQTGRGRSRQRQTAAEEGSSVLWVCGTVLYCNTHALLDRPAGSNTSVLVCRGVFVCSADRCCLSVRSGVEASCAE